MFEKTSIKVENLSKIYRLYNSPTDRLKESFHPFRKKYHLAFNALDNVSFEVQCGETLGIIGKNGSGKSTLLKILAGVLTPTCGSAAVDGRVLALLELGAGFNPELSGIENIYFYSTLLGLSSEEINAKMDAVLEFADIGNFICQPVKTYSSGMYVRLAFSVIANMDADVLIIDEALAVGDAFFVQKCMRFLRNFIKNGSLIFVSHDTSAITSLCSRVLWLQGGKIRLVGEPKEVTEEYLADYYDTQQAEDNAEGKLSSSSQLADDVFVPERDMRLDFLNGTQYRNDIELFKFEKNDKSFGLRGAEVVNAQILDVKGHPLSWCIGGENIQLRISCMARRNLQNPIVGFVVKDRLGQSIFADNTYITYVLNPQIVEEDQQFEALFSFRMPVMPCGDYSISVAIAEGAQIDHVQHQWINDAMIFKVESSSVRHGLVGIPMEKIEIRLGSKNR